MDSSIYLLLDYLYNKFIVSFILSVVGASIREIIDNVNNKKRISLRKMIIASLFSTVCMCALAEYVELNFSLYVLINVIYGMWSIRIIAFVLSTKFANVVVKSVIRNANEVVSDALKDSIEDNDQDTKDTNPKKD